MSQTSLNQVLIFLHLPKTAGRTLARILLHQYPPDSMLPLYSSNFDEELKTIPQSQLASKQLVTGHFYFGLHSVLPHPSTYLTMLRDPIDRIISHYYFVKNRSDHYLYPLTKHKSLEEYVRLCDRKEPNNDQTRLLAGIGCKTDSGECSPEMLPAAKKNLSDYFSVVGITEEFDRSLFLMKRVFGWKTPFYVKQNVTRNRPAKEEISRETLRVIQNYNEMDVELYRYAQRIFRQQLSMQGDALEKELQRFRFLNISYNRIHQILTSTVRRLGRVSM